MCRVLDAPVTSVVFMFHGTTKFCFKIQGLDRRAECSRNIFTVSFSVTHVADFPTPLGPPPYTTLNPSHRFKLTILFFLIFALVEQPNFRGSLFASSLLFFLLCVRAYLVSCLQAAVMILQVTAKICCTELRMLYFVCPERAILVQNVPYFLRISQTIHCLIA